MTGANQYYASTLSPFNFVQTRHKCWLRPSRLLLLGMLMSIPLCLLANEGSIGDSKANVSLTLSRDAATKIQLSAEQASLVQVINTIASNTGVPIHYSVLPTEQVTATCVGANVKQILECLLGTDINIVIHYKNPDSATDSGKQPREVWLLGSTLAKKMARFEETDDCIKPVVQVKHSKPKIVESDAQVDNSENQRLIETFLQMAQDPDPARRAEAIMGLGSQGQKQDEKVRRVLEGALADKSPRVRGQALFSLTRLEAEDTHEAIRQALHDNDASVRMMAIDSAENNIDILQQALTDNDKDVREYAAIKLKALEQNADLNR